MNGKLKCGVFAVNMVEFLSLCLIFLSVGMVVMYVLRGLAVEAAEDPEIQNDEVELHRNVPMKEVVGELLFGFLIFSSCWCLSVVWPFGRM